MSRITRKPPIIRSVAVVTLSLVAVTTAVTGSASAAGSTRAGASPASAGCAVFQDLSEITVQMDADDVAPAGSSVGDVAVYVDQIVDSSGTLVAEVNGTARMLYNRPSDGHLIGLWQEEVTFEGGGTALGVGATDVNELVTGKPIVETFTGTGGKYLYWHGVRQWAPTSGDTATVSMTLCPGKA